MQIGSLFATILPTSDTERAMDNEFFTLPAKLLAAIAFLVSGNLASACGSYEEPCQVSLGTYVVETPEEPGPFPAVFFLHGYAAGGYVALGVGEPMLARGYAVIGPDGENDENGLATWNLPPRGPAGRDEAEFLRQVTQHAAEQHGIDPSQILLAGHSFGGELASYIACDDPSLARAYAPLAGSFRHPLPARDECAGPVNLLYTHGWADEDVPIEGRSVWRGSFVQGDVFQAMEIWCHTNGCTEQKPDSIEVGDNYLRRSWTSCPAGSLQLAVHPGGHEIPEDWADMVLDWFEALQ